MLDKKYYKIGEQVDRLVAAGVEVLNEGAVLCEVIEGGVAKVTIVASVAGGEKIAGIAILPYMLPTSAISSETFTVPASGSLIFNLRNPLGVTGQRRAAVAGGSDLTVDEASFSATPSTGTVKYDIATGRIKFAAGDAGKVVTFTYKFALTVTAARQRYGERAINNRDLVGNLGMVGVAKGYLELATDMFDASKDYSTGVLSLGNAGTLTIGGSGAAIPGGRVLATPAASGTAQGPFLRFSALIP